MSRARQLIRKRLRRHSHKWRWSLRVAHVTLVQLAKRHGKTPPVLVRSSGHKALGRCTPRCLYIYPPALRNAWVARGVVAHEFGHWHHWHAVKNLLLVCAGTAIAILAMRFGGTAGSVVGWCLQIANLGLVNRLRLLDEEQADAFARRESRYAHSRLVKRFHSGAGAMAKNLAGMVERFPKALRMPCRAFIGLRPIRPNP